jgi:TetR/AcrR family transcriptional regulator, transcriptional repressor for nem operon
MDTKEKILQVAFNMFLQKGYKEVSLKQIVDVVGLTKGAFYHHFTGKEQLFRQIVETFLLEGGEDVYKGLPKDNLKQFMTSYLERVISFMDKMQQEIYYDNNERVGISFFLLAFDGLRLFPDFPEKIIKIHENERHTWIEVINNAKKNGEIATSISDKQLAKMFIGVNDGLGMHLMLEGRFDDIQGEIFTLWNAIYNLIKV